MQILDKIFEAATNFSDNYAIRSLQGELTYDALWKKSDSLALHLEEKLKDNKKAIVVYGHKSPWMLVCFLACVKSGRAYCPVDISMSPERVRSIMKTVGNSLVLVVEKPETLWDVAEEPEQEEENGACGTFGMPEGVEVMGPEKIQEAAERSLCISRDKWVSPEDNFYIIFTSGSTGIPKGVQISSENLSRYTDWSVSL